MAALSGDDCGSVPPVPAVPSGVPPVPAVPSGGGAKPGSSDEECQVAVDEKPTAPTLCTELGGRGSLPTPQGRKAAPPWSTRSTIADAMVPASSSDRHCAYGEAVPLPHWNGKHEPTNSLLHSSEHSAA
eukprot:gene4213-biopygen5323